MLKALTQLDLYRCSSLAALPDSIGKIGALTRLNLGVCVSLSYLPDTFGKLKALKNLNLAACTSLSALPDTINGLEALEVTLPWRMLEPSPFARRTKRAGGARSGCLLVIATR